MAYTASFKRGSQSIDLSSGYFQLDRDFTPPGSNTAWNVGEGLQANNNGGELVGSKEQDRFWSFRVKINGDSAEQSRTLANNLKGFLASLSEAEPTYFYFKNNTLPEPLWGQFGASVRYEIVTADANVGELYGLNGRRAYRYFVDVNLRIKPNAEGAQMRVANAAGGIFEDVLGSADGQSRGLVIPEATTNKVVNPVFGNATYDTGWTALNVVIAKNTDPRFCLPGLLQSMRVIGAAAGTVYVSLNVGNTNTHSFSFYVKREDGAAVTSADCDIFYNATKASTYTSLGDGWYVVSWIGAGINGATTTGLNVAAGRKVYIGGVQVEEKAAVTPLAYGDLLGCAWTGTAHASTSTRTAGIMRISTGNDTVMRQAGSAVVVWKTPEANTMAGNRRLLTIGTTTPLTLRYTVADDKFIATDTVQTISSAAQTFAAGDVFRFCLTWGAGGFNLYKNAVNIATSATFALPDIAGNMSIGHTDAVSEHADGLVMLAQTYDHELAAAEVTAIDTELAAVIASEKRPASTPWLWTKDGDGVLDNCDDSTRDNWCVIGGVPGNLAAKKIIDLAPSAAKDTYGIGGTSFKYGDFVYPTRQWFNDQSGIVDANSSGGQYVDASDVFTSMVVARPDLFNGDFNFFTRMRLQSGSSTISVVPIVYLGATAISGKEITVPAGTSMINYYIGQIRIPKKDKSMESIYPRNYAAFVVDTTIGTIYADYLMIIPGRVMKINWDSGFSDTLKIVFSDDWIISYTTAGLRYYDPTYDGDILEIQPNQLNIMWFLSGWYRPGVTPDASVITETGTFTVFITPRWSLL